MRGSLKHSVCLIVGGLTLLGGSLIADRAAAQASPPSTQPAPRRLVVYTPPPPSAGSHDVVPGATRGSDDLPIPTLFVPSAHTGLTCKTQPVLYYYLPKATKNKIVITFQNVESDETISAPPIDGASEKGLQRFDMSAIGKSLAPGSKYKWTVSVRYNGFSRSKDANASASLACVTPPADLSSNVGGKSAEEQAAIYANNHLWFDTVDAEIQAIKAKPQDDSLQQEFQQLLVAGDCHVSAAEAASVK